jgi:hypothetical protein
MKPPEGVWRHSLSFVLGALCTLALVLLGAGPRWQGGSATGQQGIARSGRYTRYFQIKCCARWRSSAGASTRHPCLCRSACVSSKPFPLL